MADRRAAITEHHAAHRARLWGVGTVALIAAIGLGVIAFNRSSPTGSSAAAVPIASSAEVESYAWFVQGTQKASFAAQKSMPATSRSQSYHIAQWDTILSYNFDECFQSIPINVNRPLFSQRHTLVRPV